ncbi:MAG: energy-coupling factor transporter transmembrane component T family protein [Spirochaetales bacterium]
MLRRLHPLTKLILFILLTVLILVEKNPCSLILSLAFLIFCAAKGEIPPSKLVRNYRWMIVAAVIGAFSVLIKEKSVAVAAIPVARLCLILIMSSVLNITTTPTEIAYAAGMIIPSRDFTMMVSISLSFVPVLAQEAARISDAQKARGAKRTKAAVATVIPLFASAFRRASDLADAMTVRAYGTTDKPSRLYTPVFSKTDLYSILFSLVFAASVIVMEVL